MLSIYICEDNPVLLQHYQMLIENIILIEEYDMEIRAAVTQPDELLNAAKTDSALDDSHNHFYLLDIDLHNDIDGFALAKEIRRFDSRGFIVFITTHSEMAMLTFQYQIEAMDFITKDDCQNLGARIHACMETALERYHVSPEVSMIAFKVGNHFINIEQNQILYVTSTDSPHKIKVVTSSGYSEFYGTLNNCAKDLTNDFIRCHKAFIVNKNHIQSIDRKALTLTLSNGETCIASTRGINHVIRAVKENFSEFAKS